LLANTTGTSNVALGTNALGANTTASNNTGLGFRALFVNTTGASNTAVGTSALTANTTASNNTAVGTSALAANTTGTENVAVGTNAGNTITTGNYNLCVGYNTDTGSASSDRRFVIGQDFNGTTNNAVHIGASGGHIRNDFLSDATWDQVSDVRKKTNIEDNSMGLEFINGLRTVIFNFKAPSEYPEEWQEYDASQTEPVVKDKKIGLIAQEVKAVIDELGIEHYDGIWGEKPNGQQEIGPSDYIFPLIKAIQELSTQLDAALARITTLEGAN
jgi:trimeric autotransporter adhesin